MRIIRICNNISMTPNSMREPKREPVPPKPVKADGPTPLDSAELFKHRDEIVIQHAGELYRLRRTRNGKLILTK